ncbi:MAG: YkvA family protein [Oleiphilaceae bacterium]|nr:YkvA family protein [Oleiphilaceae bacterium]
MGEELLYHVLVLYNTLQSPDTPLWYRGVILGSLGYFLSTIDGIPDFTPVLGFSDDLVVLTAAASTLSKYITPQIKDQSRAQTERIAQRIGKNQT